MPPNDKSSNQLITEIITLRIVALLAGLVFCTLVVAKPNQPIEVLIEEWAPMHFINAQGEIDGALIDVTNAVFEQAGLTPKYRIAPFARSLKMLPKSPNTVMLSVGRNPQREQDYYWLSPIYFDRPVLITHQDNTKVVVNDIIDIFDYTFASVRGYLRLQDPKFEKHYTEGENLIVTSTIKQTWDLLFAHRADVIVTTQYLARFEAESFGYSGDDIRGLIPLQNELIPMYAVTSRHSDPELIFKLEQAYGNFVTSVEYDSIMEKWQIRNSLFGVSHSSLKDSTGGS